MDEIIKNLFVGSHREAEDWIGDKRTVICTSDGYNMPDKVTWIPLMINDKMSKNQLNLLAMTIHSELSNNNQILVYGHYDTDIEGVAYYLHIIKNILLSEASEMIKSCIAKNHTSAPSAG